MKKQFLFAFSFLTLAINSLTSQTLTATVLQQPCNNDGVVVISISGIAPPYDITYTNFGFQTIHYNVSSSTDTIKNIEALNTYWNNSYDLYINVGNNLGVSGFTTATIYKPFTYTISSTPAICPNITGTASVTTSFFNQPTVEWAINTWQQTTFNTIAIGNPVSLPPGYYDVRVTDPLSGCAVRSYSYSAYINNQSGITFTRSVTPANCTNGSISVSTPTGGLAPYSYLWSNGATSPSVTGLSKGFYAVTVTDSQGCSELMQYINVPQTPTITVNTSVGNATCLQLNGTATAFASGGTGPYSYAWTSGATNQTATNLGGGTNYQVFVTDNNGCSGNGYAYVGYNTPINVTYSISPSLCTGPTGSASLTPIGGTPPYNTIWSTAPITIGSVISNKPAGSYYFNVTDAVGCKRSGTINISQASTFTANISAINPVCPASFGTAFANVSGSNPPFTYQWSNGATTHSISNANPGVYSCTITDAAQCAITKSGSINIINPVNVSMNSTPSSCIFTNDGSITGSASGGTAPYNFFWSNGQVGPSATSLLPGNYYLSVTDANGCHGNGYTYISSTNSDNSCYCTINGNVYNDVNSNCIKNAGDNGIANQMIHCSGFGYVFTNSNGNYSFQVPSGTYTITQVLNSNNYQLSACQSVSTVVTVVASSGCSHTVNFSNAVIPIHDLQITTTSLGIPAVVGNPYTQRIIVQNNGTVSEPNTQIAYKKDGQLFYINNTPTLLTQQNTSTYPDWFSQNSSPSLAPGASAIIDVNYNVPTNIPIGTNLSFYDTTSYAAPLTTTWLLDNSPWNNVNTFETSVVAAYDPNYKEVSPKGITPQGLIAPKDSILNYVVHFQNEGSYFAQNIVVVDTLDADLNWLSFKPGYSDHNFTANISESGVLTYTFKNINLPWKQTYGDPLSSGMFCYSIKTKPNLALGTKFINGAAIYFDYNAPVMTNKTLNTLSDASVGIDKVDKLVSSELVLYPNPTNGIVTINSLQDMKSIEVYSITGVLQLSSTSSTKTQQLQLDHFTDGIYFVKVIYANGMSVTKKVVKH